MLSRNATMSTRPRYQANDRADDDAELSEVADAPGGPPPREQPPGPVLAVFRWVGLHVRGFYGAVGVFLIVGVLLILVTGILFAYLAEEMMEGETQAFDHAVMVWMGENGTPTLTILAQEVTALGSGLVVWMVILVASAFLWTNKHRYSVALLWVAMAGAGIISSTL